MICGRWIRCTNSQEHKIQNICCPQPRNLGLKSGILRAHVQEPKWQIVTGCLMEEARESGPNTLRARLNL
jgi:hypothetical protein